MAEETTQAQPEKTEPKQEAPDHAKEIATLKEQNTKLTGDLSASVADSDKAKRYVVGLVKRFQESSAQPKAKADPEDQEDAFKEALENNPEAAMDAHFNRRMQPIMAEQYGAGEVRDREAARMKIGADRYDKYSEEIESFISTMTPSTKAHPGAHEEAFNYVRMQHFDEEVAEAVQGHMTKKESDRKMTAEGSTSTSPGRGPAKGSLSSMEREIMGEMGIDEDTWRKFGGGNSSGYAEEPGD